MNGLKKSNDNSIPTIIFIVLAFVLFAFASSKNKDDFYSPNSSICLFVDIHTNTQAVIPASTDLPICFSFTDESNVILNHSFLADYSINLKIDNEFSTAEKNQLKIKPVLNKLFRRLVFPDPESVDFIANS